MTTVSSLRSSAAPPPVHVAIIMDGNGRWAQARGLPRIAGHRQGAESVRAAIRASTDLGVRYLTLYGFSIENWKRPSSEVSGLMGLLRLYLKKEIGELLDQGVNLRVIGQREKLAPDIVAMIEDAEFRTKDNSALNLTVALSYGGRQEITATARKLAEKVRRGEIDPSDIDETMFAQNLETAGIPDPDLLIRTSGEERVSNFLLWQIAYSELVFTDTLWPDFSRDDLEEAIKEFHRRDRRYGATG